MKILKKLSSIVSPAAHAQAVVRSAVPTAGQAGKPVSSYRALIYEEYDSQTKPLQAKLKKLEAKQRELAELFQKTRDQQTQKTILASSKKVEEQREKTQTALYKAMVYYKPPEHLVGLADDLDRAKQINQGEKIIMQLYGQLEAMLPTINKAFECYGRGLAVPPALASIRDAVLRELHAVKVGGAGIIRHIDIEKTEVKFNAALADYELQLQERDASAAEYLKITESDKLALETELAELN